MSLFQIVLLALIQGAAELLPISSSAHVIVAERWMGLDPSSPEMTFLLVMLHTGTMFAVLLYFWPRWRKLKWDFVKAAFLATAVTGVAGLLLKKGIEKCILTPWLGEANAEVEQLFKSLPLIALALLGVGAFIIYAGIQEKKRGGGALTLKNAAKIGLVQGLCLPFRGFSRSGATISVSLLSGISRGLAEDFSFALAVLLTPPVIVLELHRLLKAAQVQSHLSQEFLSMLAPGFLGMVFSFLAGIFALKWLSSWLERGKWKVFGIYCIVASLGVLLTHFTLS